MLNYSTVLILLLTNVSIHTAGRMIRVRFRVVVLKFADDTEIVSEVASEDQIKILQSELHETFNWSQDWQMLFNTAKSKVMHFGLNNKEVD